ncbi:hypothetical protein [Xanthomonas arboricola]|uniref:hypothetical protein n=1 Tax=Xanthomonas arboricola TaxID=56448 RepID=UPI0012D2EC50|nr:hypothetical protein [Xanthomonas arboricola]
MNGELQLGEFAETLKLLRPQNPEDERQAKSALVDPRSVVYGVLTRSDRREQGVFFSGDAWAQRMINLVDVSRWQRIIDPSAGIGDLLIAVAHRLPLGGTLGATLESWSRILCAVDLRASFLDIAWARIRAVAINRHAKLKDHEFSLSLNNKLLSEMPLSFKVADVMNFDFELKQGDCIVMNPPYQRMQAPENSIVGTGLRTAAGLHLEKLIKQAPPGVGIVALIPDVIRSGSSYRKFRLKIERLLDVKMLESVGHFGDSADVDVAILVGVTKAEAVSQLAPLVSSEEKPAITLEDVASIGVGPVVPHRTGENGNCVGYITTRNVPIDAEILHPSEFATYNCRLEQAPFLVVRRTSSPSDRRRARASLIRGNGLWLVENHLIIVRPKTPTIVECRRIHASLSDPRSDIWLNQKIRCRHLTVSVMKSLPIWG